MSLFLCNGLVAAGKLLGNIAFNPGMILLSLGSREKCIPERAEPVDTQMMIIWRAIPPICLHVWLVGPPPLAFLPFISANLRTPANDWIFWYSWLVSQGNDFHSKKLIQYSCDSVVIQSFSNGLQPQLCTGRKTKRCDQQLWPYFFALRFRASECKCHGHAYDQRVVEAC